MFKWLKSLKFLFKLGFLFPVLWGTQAQCGVFSAYYDVQRDKVVYVGAFQGLGYRPRFDVDGADPKTFKDLGDGYGRDAHLAFLDGHVIAGADGASFELIKGPFSRDKNQVFYKSHALSHDPKNFAIIAHDAVYYSKDSSTVYAGVTPIVGADVASFTELGEGYFKDKMFVYYGSQAIADSDSSSAKPIPGGVRGHYAKDAKHVYRDGKIIVDADPGSFEKIDDVYWRDKNHVFYHDKILSLDVKNFRILRHPSGVSPRYARDENKVYSRNRELPGADPQTFVVLNYWYTKDKNTVWHDDKPLSGADSANFKALDDDYGKDGKTVFYKNQIVPDADAPTFRMEKKKNPSFAVDKNHVYWLGKIRRDKRVDDF